MKGEKTTYKKAQLGNSGAKNEVVQFKMLLTLREKFSFDKKS